MADVERLYGVIHGSETTFAGARLYDSLVAPSRELMADILSLPLGSSVGIETCPELSEQLVYKGETFETPEKDRFYWSRVKRLCARRGLNVEYLEDFETYSRYLDTVIEEDSLYEELQSARMTGDDEKVRELLPSIYAVKTRGEYMHLFDREEAIFANIAKKKPTIAIIGRGHSDPHSQGGFENAGFSVGEYRAESVYYDPGNWLEKERRYERADLEFAPAPMKNVLVDRELAARRFRAVTEGRVMAEGNPDYIGTWDLRIPAQGLFEIYLNPDGQTGKIEDSLGTASFGGRIWDDELTRFSKRYLRDSERRGQDAPISYEARFENGEFVGLYSGVDIAPSEFRMRKYNGTPYSVSV